jgi:L-rhamnose-H+ transport protein
VLGTQSGLVILLGIGVCLVGITFAGIAGMSKEKEMSAEQKTESIKEFNFKRGLMVAIFSGVMSACFSFGLDAGNPITKITLAHGTPALWQGLPKLVIILLGGFTTNFLWCLMLNVKNRTGYQYFTAQVRGEQAQAPLVRNYLLCALAGTAWYMQFFFYTMGEAQMGSYKFSCWTMQMASIIIFSSLWGIALHEWRGTSRRTRVLLGISLALLVASTIIVGYGNYLAA